MSDCNPYIADFSNLNLGEYSQYWKNAGVSTTVAPLKGIANSIYIQDLGTGSGLATGYDALGNAITLGGVSAGGAGLTPAQLAQLNTATTQNTAQATQITALQTSQTAQDALIAVKMNKTTGANTGGKILISSGTTGLNTVESIVAQSTFEGALGNSTYTNPATLDTRLSALETAQPTFNDVLAVNTLPTTGQVQDTLYVVKTGANKDKSFYWDGTQFNQTDNEVQSFATTLPATGVDGVLYIVKTGANKGAYYWDGVAFQPTTNVVAGVPANLALGAVTGTTQTITNSNGTGVTLPSATPTTAGLMSSADKTKLDAVVAPTTNVIDLTAGVLTTTVNGVVSNAVTIADTTTANNGLTKIGVNVQLGGALIAPTVITTDATNTLALAGLTVGAVTDTHLVVTPAGVLKLALVELPFELLNQIIPASGSLVVNHNKNDITKMPVIDIMGLPNSPILADYSSAATNNLQITNRTANAFTIRNINSSAAITLDIRVK